MSQQQIKLRQIELRDATGLAALNADPGVQKYLEGCTTPARCENTIGAWQRLMRDDVQWYYAAVDEHDHLMGVVTIIREGDDDGTYHLTLAVSKERRGKGVGFAIATEAVTLARGLAGVKSLSALIENDNASSRALFGHFDANPTRQKLVKELPEREVVQWRYIIY